MTKRMVGLAIMMMTVMNTITTMMKTEISKGPTIAIHRPSPWRSSPSHGLVDGITAPIICNCIYFKLSLKVYYIFESYVFDHPSTFLSPSIQTANISKTNWCFLCKWTLYSKEMIRYGCYCKTKARLADNSRREFLLLSTTNAIGHSVLQLAHQRYASHIGLWIPKILGFSRVSSSRLHRADNGSSLAGHRCCKSCLRGPVVSVLVDWWWCASHFASSTTGRLPTAPALPMPFQCTLHVMRIIFINGPGTREPTSTI